MLALEFITIVMMIVGAIMGLSLFFTESTLDTLVGILGFIIMFGGFYMATSLTEIRYENCQKRCTEGMVVFECSQDKAVCIEGEIHE